MKSFTIFLCAVALPLALACLGGVADGQIVIPPGVLEKLPPKKIKPKTPATRPAGVKADMQRLLMNFRAAAGDGPKRQEAAEALLKTGPRGAATLRRIVTADLPVRTANYKKAFYNESRSIASKKYLTTGSAKIKSWRDQFESMGSVTKESLKAKGGPAMDGLYGALVPSRTEVLESSKSLAGRRAELLSLESILARCNDELKRKSSDSGLSKTLEQQETLISLMCTSMPESHRKLIEADLKQFKYMSFDEWHGFVHLNVVRVLLGLSPMRVDLRLSAAGRGHSKDMNERRFFSHASPVPGKSTPWARAALQGTKSRGECIASGMRSGPGAIRAWFFSPGHHKIIMSGASRVGIGKYSRKWTLMTG